MKKEQGTFKSTNQVDNIMYYKYLPDEKPTGIVQLVHGMAEHASRYELFAEHLVNRGYVVFIHEHMGHGGSVKDESELGQFLNSHQGPILVADSIKMMNQAKKEYPDLKLVLFGHSMGSFIARLMASEVGDQLAGLVISGTGGPNKLANVGKVMTGINRFFLGARHKSKMMDKMSFGNFTEKYENVRTSFDWLSRDTDNVDRYIADEYCGYLFSDNGLFALLDVNIRANKEETYKNTNKELPILLVSGSMDPVGDYGAGVETVYSNYKSAGLSNVTMKLFEDDRHEILNEVDKDIVTTYIGDYIESKLS